MATNSRPCLGASGLSVSELNGPWQQGAAAAAAAAGAAAAAAAVHETEEWQI